MSILIVILIGWFDWLVYSAHHRLQPLSAKMCLQLHTVVLYKIVLSLLCNLVCAMFFVRKLEL